MYQRALNLYKGGASDAQVFAMVMLFAVADLLPSVICADRSHRDRQCYKEKA